MNRLGQMDRYELIRMDGYKQMDRYEQIRADG